MENEKDIKDNKPKKVVKIYDMLYLFFIAINVAGMELLVFTFLLFPELNIFTWSIMMVILFPLLVTDFIYLGFRQIKKLLRELLG